MKLTPVLRYVSKLPKDYSNLPESYKKRFMDDNFLYWRTPPGPQYQRKEIRREKFNYGMHRPWSTEFVQENMPGIPYKKIYVEPVKDWNFFRGDRVEILTGKDKGKIGIVNYIVMERNWVTVEGLNCTYKTVGATADFPGVMIKDEQPLRITDEVSLIDPSDDKPTKVEWRYTDNGELVRVSTRTGRVIPIPKMAEETIDYKSKAFYTDQSCDTVVEDVEKITFEPKLATFEQDIMKEMGLVEERKPHPTYWY